MSERVDFGFADVAAKDKPAMVGRVFSAVAPYYDRMNDILSGGAHRLWKNAAALMLDVRRGMRVLDLAGGSGDMSARLSPAVGDDGVVVTADINAAMLGAGARRRTQARAVQCDGERLPFSDRTFDRVIISFGLRNITHRARALGEIRRVLKTGGKYAVLEFSPVATLPRLHRRYLTTVLPFVGALAANDAASYRYLGESILRFPSPAQLSGMLRAAGFDDVRYLRFAAGAVALHYGRRGC